MTATRVPDVRGGLEKKVDIQRVVRVMVVIQLDQSYLIARRLLLPPPLVDVHLLSQRTGSHYWAVIWDPYLVIWGLKETPGYRGQSTTLVGCFTRHRRPRSWGHTCLLHYPGQTG